GRQGTRVPALGGLNRAWVQGVVATPLKKGGCDVSAGRTGSSPPVLVVNSRGRIKRASCRPSWLRQQDRAEVVQSGWRRGPCLRHSTARRPVSVRPGARGDPCRRSTRRLHAADC